MIAKQDGAWRAILLPLAALVLMLPMRSVPAGGAGGGAGGSMGGGMGGPQPAVSGPRPPAGLIVRPRPELNQMIHYNEALRLWELWRMEQRPERRMKLFDRTMDHFAAAIAAPFDFPEPVLGMGLLFYERNAREGRMLWDAYRAERLFGEVVGSTRGAMRVEALTYLGVLALRCRHWEMAKRNFEAALQELSVPEDQWTSSSDRKNRAKILQAWRSRLKVFDCVARVGSVLATFYMANHPSATPITNANYEAVLREIDRLLPQNQIQMCEPVFSGPNAAIWRFPERTPQHNLGFPALPMARVDWSLSLTDPRPADVRALTLQQLVQSLRVWAGAELHFRPGIPVPPAEGLAPEDRRNLIAGLIRRLFDVEGEPGFYTGGPPAQEALRVLDLLAQFPEMALTVRQHRIWIRLEALVDLAEARRLIYGPGAADDPLIYEEHFALAQKYRQRGMTAQAEEELRLIINGIPGVPGPNTPADVRTAQEAARRFLRPLAEWNLAVSALNLPGMDSDPAKWRQALSTLTPAPNREFLRLFLAFRLAEALVRRKAPAAELTETLGLIDRIAAGQEGMGTRAIPEANVWLEIYFRYLADLAFQGMSGDMYEGVLAPRTIYYTERRAGEAAQIYNQSRPMTGDAYNTILQKLQAALRLLPANAPHADYWRGRLQADIAAVQKFQMDHADFVRRQMAYEARLAYVNEWNAAADHTWESSKIRLNRQTAQQAVDAWTRAVQMWTAIYQKVPADAQMEKEEAGARVVGSHMKVADSYVAMGNRAEAARHLDQAEQALNSLTLSANDKAMFAARIAHNRRALVGSVPTGRGLGNYRPWPAGVRFRPPSPRSERFCILIDEDRLPRVRDFISALRADRRAQELLLEWFNVEGPRRLGVQGDPRVKRDFDLEPGSPNNLVDFLAQHIHPTAGVLPPNTRQWAYDEPAQRWIGPSMVGARSAGYFVGGRPILNARCANPIDVIRVVQRGGWTFYHECPIWLPKPFAPTVIQGPIISYPMPTAPFMFPPMGYYDYPTASVGAPVIPIIPPAISLLMRPMIPPRLIIPKVAIPPLSAPWRITIGRISSIEAWKFPLRVTSGTAENRREVGGSPEGQVYSSRSNPGGPREIDPDPRKRPTVRW
jgi:hypothetical protein